MQEQSETSMVREILRQLANLSSKVLLTEIGFGRRGNRKVRAAAALRKHAREHVKAARGKESAIRGSGATGLREHHFLFDGELQRGTNTQFAVNGQDFTYDSSTWVFGEMREGNHAVVRGVLGEGGERRAVRIIVTQDY